MGITNLSSLRALLISLRRIAYFLYQTFLLTDKTFLYHITYGRHWGCSQSSRVNHIRELNVVQVTLDKTPYKVFLFHANIRLGDEASAPKFWTMVCLLGEFRSRVTFIVHVR